MINYSTAGALWKELATLDARLNHHRDQIAKLERTVAGKTEEATTTADRAPKEPDSVAQIDQQAQESQRVRDIERNIERDLETGFSKGLEEHRPKCDLCCDSKKVKAYPGVSKVRAEYWRGRIILCPECGKEERPRREWQQVCGTCNGTGHHCSEGAVDFNKCCSDCHGTGNITGGSE